MTYVKRSFLVLFVLFSPLLQAQERLRLATTTSVQDTGLMDRLQPYIEKKCGCKLDVIAVGTGQALKLASNGDVDMVIVHDPAAEARFVGNGSGINRKTFMSNDFVILGPVSDPAHIRGMKNAAQAFATIQKAGSTFVSRGDESGTNQKEKALWQKAGIKPAGSSYWMVGQGMGATLTIADEKQAYTLCDRSTYLSRVKHLKIRLLVEGDPDLINYYSAIQVNPARFSSIKANLSHQLIEWLCSQEGQKLIGEYTVGGHTLYKPSCQTGK